MFSCLAANVSHLACLWKSPEPKNCSASAFTCLYYARGQTDSTSELLGVASEIKSEGNDLTEILLVTRQKLVVFVGAVALMWFHKQAGDESGLESC